MTSELVLISSDEYDSLSSSSSPPPFKTSKSVPLLMEDSPTKCEDSSDETIHMKLHVLIYLIYT